MPAVLFMRIHTQNCHDVIDSEIWGRVSCYQHGILIPRRSTVPDEDFCIFTNNAHKLNRELWNNLTHEFRIILVE